jgi:bifunctional non-homologous end joining protein LigD
MNIDEYIESRRQAIKRIPSEIRERWHNRVVKNSWHLLGIDGAFQYLEKYGKGISATKVINLAICAEFEGYPEVALGFWNQAFEIETGKILPTKRQAKISKAPHQNSLSETPIATSTTTTPEWKNRIFIPDLPPHLQPGTVAQRRIRTLGCVLKAALSPLGLSNVLFFWFG